MIRKETDKLVEMTLHTEGLYTSDILLLEAVREVNLFDHAGIRTGDPRSDRRQVQDFTTELQMQSFLYTISPYHVIVLYKNTYCFF